MAVTRLASTDAGYTTGVLSLFPGARDSKYQLYEATNNSETTLKQSLTYNGKYIVVQDTTGFPDNGIIRIGPSAGQIGPAEMVYYDSKTISTFKNLIRGFAGSRQNPWPVGSYVSNAVFAEHHNSTKDAVIQIERDLGVKTLPDPLSLNGILKAQETRFLSPRPIFRSYPSYAVPGTQIRFQNFSTGPLIRYLWDFGDGTTSVEKSPIHAYQKEGIYTVSLNVINSLGAQGITTKNNYINISHEARPPFLYVPATSGFSAKTTGGAIGSNPENWDYINAFEFDFVDQTDGDILQRYWVFDGVGQYKIENGPWTYHNQESIAVSNPNAHTIKFRYAQPGYYNPSLLILLDNQTFKRAYLSENITVL